VLTFRDESELGDEEAAAADAADGEGATAQADDAVADAAPAADPVPPPDEDAGRST
jgi:hypothetical protein